MIEGRKFARKCSVTGEGMNQGYVLHNGEMYFSTEELAEIHLQILGYTSFEEAFNQDVIYWTDWDIEDIGDNDVQYIVKNGELVEID